MDDETSFNRGFAAFESFFGNPEKSYWIGLNLLNYYTNYEKQTLLVSCRLQLWSFVIKGAINPIIS